MIENLENEIWKDVKRFEKIYQVSNYGRIKSLKRKGRANDKLISTYIGSSDGYLCVKLLLNGKRLTLRVHILVGDAFLGERPYKHDINHKDSIRSNANLNNLEWCTRRQNTTHGYMKKQTSSKYTGVHWNKKRNKWESSISIDGKNVFLGRYIEEYEAHIAYQNKVKTLEF